MSTTTIGTSPRTQEAAAHGTPEAEAVATLVVAFAADPVIRWLLPGGRSYLDGFTELVRLVSRAAFAAGTADCAPGTAGAAVWLAPGTSLPDEEAGEILGRSVAEHHQADAFSLLERMDEQHPTEPHWYLPFIGVDPGRQGRGHGSALLRIGLARCDRDGLPAYLEASSPRNRALYERHGFETVAEIRVADSPPLWPMRRPAR